MEDAVQLLEMSPKFPPERCAHHAGGGFSVPVALHPSPTNVPCGKKFHFCGTICRGTGFAKTHQGNLPKSKTIGIDHDERAQTTRAAQSNGSDGATKQETECQAGQARA